jgi:gamma-glutamyltranspeptidase
MAALEILNIMEQMPADPAGPSSAGELHRRIEAMKLAYADVFSYNADPRFCPPPVTTLLSRRYARERAAAIDPERANANAGLGDAGGCDTVYLTVIDREGNIASWIRSIFSSFGSRIVVDGMGFVLQNRGAGFTLDAAHPNALEGGKRPLHTTIPGFLKRGERRAGFFKTGPSGVDVTIEARVTEPRCGASRKWAIGSHCDASIRKRWDADRRSSAMLLPTRKRCFRSAFRRSGSAGAHPLAPQAEF